MVGMATSRCGIVNLLCAPEHVDAAASGLDDPDSLGGVVGLTGRRRCGGVSLRRRLRILLTQHARSKEFQALEMKDNKNLMSKPIDDEPLVGRRSR